MEKQIKKAVELEAIHRVISNNLVDAVWSVDVGTLTFEYISDSIEKTSGFQADEYTGKSIGKTMTPETFQRVFRTVKKAVSEYKNSNQKVWSVELELIHKSERRYWVEVKARLLDTYQGTLKLIGVTKDITDRKKREQEKDESIARLEKLISENERLLKENKILTGLLPICSGCKRIRDEAGKWWPLDAYVRQHTDAEFTHTICTDCNEVFYQS